jgi:hypothetical protein
MAIPDRDHDTEATELPARAHLHLLEDVGGKQHGMGIQGTKHSVDGSVLDVLGLELIRKQVPLQEREHLSQPVGELPETIDPRHVQWTPLIMNLQDRLSLAALVVYENWSHRPLYGVQRAKQHTLRLGALRLDVVVLDFQNGTVEHLQRLGRHRQGVSRCLGPRGCIDVDIEAVSVRPSKCERKGRRHRQAGNQDLPDG